MKKHATITLLFNAILLICGGQEKRPLIVGEQVDLHSKYNNRSYEISNFLPETTRRIAQNIPVYTCFMAKTENFLLRVE